MIPQGSLRLSARDDLQIPRSVVERDWSIRSAHDDVFDSGAVTTRQIDARLDTEGHSRLQRFAIAGDQVRVFMSLEADPVPGAVEELFAVALGRDELSGRCVDRLTRD